WGVQRLADVACTAENALDRDDFAAFLSRVSTFSENCRRLLCWILTGLKAERGSIRFAQVEKSNSDLAEYLLTQGLRRLNDPPAKPTWRTDRDFFAATI